jgi:hypothetical protein
MARACCAPSTPPGSLTRQSPPSRAATMRVNAGQADGRNEGNGAWPKVRRSWRRTTATLSRRRENAHRYTPPGDGLHERSGRLVSWLAGRRPHRPSRFSSGTLGCGLAAYSCGGSHSFYCVPMEPRRAPAKRYYAFFHCGLETLPGVAAADRE